MHIVCVVVVENYNSLPQPNEVKLFFKVNALNNLFIKLFPTKEYKETFKHKVI